MKSVPAFLFGALLPIEWVDAGAGSTVGNLTNAEARRGSTEYRRGVTAR